MPFRIALSGLEAASTNLEVTGNNIANASTHGFKQSRTEFADVYASSISDSAQSTPGSGVKVSRIAQQFSQGNVNFTSNSLDLALNGSGFFILEDVAGSVSYTRAGAFNVDRNGYVTNHANQRLQAYPAVITGTSTTFNTGTLSDLLLPTAPGAPNVTTNVSAALNLDAGETVPAFAFDPTDANTYNHSTSTTVYDSVGAAHTSVLYYRKAAGAGLWDSYQYIDGMLPANNVTAGGAAPDPVTLQFNTSGLLTAVDGVPGTTLTYDPHNLGAGVDPLTLTFDYANTTQYGTPFGVTDLSQNGYTSGLLSGMEVDDSGVVYARFTNGQSRALGKVALASFNNPAGLQPLGDTNWGQSFGSGDRQLGEAGTASYGLIQSGALEDSNVDLANQLVKLITAQRAFQANAEVISTADTVNQTIINIR